MTNEREPQAVQNPLLFWVKRQTNTPRRALLFDVLSQVNAKIHLLKPKIEKKCSEIMGCSLFTSQTACCKLFSCKFGFEWLISSACSCLSEIDPESIGSEYQNVLLKLKRTYRTSKYFSMAYRTSNHFSMAYMKKSLEKLPDWQSVLCFLLVGGGFVYIKDSQAVMTMCSIMVSIMCFRVSVLTIPRLWI